MNKNIINTITYAWLSSTSLFLYTYELHASSCPTTLSLNAFSQEQLWIAGSEEKDLSKLKESLKSGYTPNQKFVNLAFKKAALINRRDIMEWLLTRPSSIPLPDQDGVNIVFRDIYFGYPELMIWLLTRPSGIPLPDQDGVNLIFEETAKNNNVESIKRRNIEVIRWLLTRPSGIPLPNQEGVNKAFPILVKNQNFDIIEWLLTQPAGLPLPDQEGINKAFYFASSNIRVMEWLLTQPAGLPLPGQDGVNQAFKYAAEYNKPDVIEWLLSQPAGLPLPDPNTIITAYRELCSRRNQTPETANILRIMDPIVALEERINQGRGPNQIRQEETRQELNNALRQIDPNSRMAFEIHDYADARVPSSTASECTSQTENQRLFDAVLNTIDTRIQRFDLVKIDLIRLRLMSAIEHIYTGNPEKITLATQALNQGYSYENAPDYLQKVMTFLDHLPTPRLKFDLWFKGFIEESIEAYINSQHQLSCTKGIQERILTGLRGVDPGLDQIFKHAEASLLMKNYIKKQFNVYDKSMQHNIAIILKENRINAGSKVEDAQRVLQNHIMLQLSQYEIEIPADIQESVRVIVEIFGDIYDEKIKPLL